VKVNPAIHKGMPYKYYHGRTGIVFNVTKRAIGVRINKEVNGKVLEKRINVRIEHATPSKCRDEFLSRVKKNEQIKQAVRAGTMQRQNLKRLPILPKAAYTVKLPMAETIQPIPFSNLL
jgi:large subunit ribosomal protein L21e